MGSEANRLRVGLKPQNHGIGRNPNELHVQCKSVIIYVFLRKRKVNSGFNKVTQCTHLVVICQNKKIKMGCGPGSPVGVEDKAPWTSWMFNFWGQFTYSPYPHKQETGHNTGYFFLSWVATSLLSRKFWGKGRFVKNQEKSWEITGLWKKIWILSQMFFIITCSLFFYLVLLWLF